MQSCPTSEQLSQLLTAKLSAEEREALEEHLDSCSHCLDAFLHDSRQENSLQAWKRMLPSDGIAGLRAAPSTQPAVAVPENNTATDGVDADTVNVHRPGTDKRNGMPDSNTPKIPDYEILGELGRGGMGIVYKARQKSLDRLVAIKLLSATMSADSDHLARFRSEAEVIASLQHPGIVQIYQLGEHGALPYLVLEYVDGPNLAEFLNHEPQAPHLAARLTESLARTIHAAHEAGVIHRDLKPANVLMSGEWRVARGEGRSNGDLCDDNYFANVVPKITDFGLAKRLDGDGIHTQSGIIAGTPCYLSPEQAEGKSRDVIAAADIYALGVILYEMLTGHPPFKSPNPVETLRQTAENDPVPPRTFRSDIPRDLETICLKCLEKQPSKRYVTALELAEDVQRFHTGKPIKARPVHFAERAWRWCRRNSLATSLLLAVFLCLAIGTSVSSFFAVESNQRANTERIERQRADKQAEIAKANEIQARKEKLRADKEKRKVRRYLYAAQMLLAQNAWRDDNIPYLLDLLESPRPAKTDGMDLRGFEWYYWMKLCSSESLRMDHQRPIHSMALIAGGKQIAAAERDGKVSVWDATTGKRLFDLDCQAAEGVNQIHLVAHNDFLVCAYTQGMIQVWDLKSRKKAAEFETGCYPFAVDFHPDGTRIALGGFDAKEKIKLPGIVGIWDWKNGKELKRFHADPMRVESVCYSANGNYIAGGNHKRSVKVWNLRSGQPSHQLQLPTVVARVAVSPNGKLLAAIANNGSVRVWNLGPQAEEILTLENERALDVCFSPDSKYLAVGTNDRLVNVWNIDSKSRDFVFKGHTSRVTNVAFKDDGNSIVSASHDGTIRCWPLKQQIAQTFEPDRYAISTNGELLALCNWQRDPRSKKIISSVLDIRNLKNGKGVFSDAVENAIKNLAFSPKHNRIAIVQTKSSNKNANRVLVYNHQSGDTEFSVFDKTRPTHAAFTPNGQNLITWRSNTFSSVTTIWDIAKAQPIRTFKGIFLAISSQGDRIATASHKPINADNELIEINIWNLATGKLHFTDSLPHRIDSLTVPMAVFSSDGKWFVTLCPGMMGVADSSIIRVWNLAKNKEQHSYISVPTFRLPTGGAGLHPLIAVNPANKWLAYVDSDSNIQVVELETGKQVHVLKSYAGNISTMIFSPDGKRLATASKENGVILWDTQIGQKVLHLPLQTNGDITELTFSNDGRRLFAAGQWGRLLKIWSGQ